MSPRLSEHALLGISDGVRAHNHRARRVYAISSEVVERQGERTCVASCQASLANLRVSQ